MLEEEITELRHLREEALQERQTNPSDHTAEELYRQAVQKAADDLISEATSAQRLRALLKRHEWSSIAELSGNPARDQHAGLHYWCMECNGRQIWEYDGTPYNCQTEGERVERHLRLVGESHTPDCVLHALLLEGER